MMMMMMMTMMTMMMIAAAADDDDGDYYDDDDDDDLTFCTCSLSTSLMQLSSRCVYHPKQCTASDPRHELEELVGRMEVPKRRKGCWWLAKTMMMAGRRAGEPLWTSPRGCPASHRPPHPSHPPQTWL